MTEPPSSTTNDDDNFRIIQSTSFQKKSDKNMEKHKNLFHCSLCDELVNPKKAKLMPCLHTICALCEISADKIEDMIICAKCNQKWAQEDITEHYLVRASYTTLIKCTSCFDNLIAKFKCSDCDDFLCNICANAHRRVKLTKHHCLSQLNADCPATEPCNKHNGKEIDKFCITCSDLLCVVCQSEKHSGHVIQPLEERVSHYNKNMISSLDKLKMLSDEVDMNDKSVGKHLKDIDEFEQEIKDHLRLLMAEIEATCADKRKPFLKLKSCSDIFSSAANQIASFVEATLDCPNKVVALCHKDIIHSAFYRASELFNAAKSLTPNLESLSPLPNAKKIVDRLVIDVATTDDQSNQTIDDAASGTANGADVNRNQSKCVTPPARLSISPRFGCSRQQTTTKSDIPAEVTTACPQAAGHTFLPRPSVIHVPNDNIPTMSYAPANAQPMVRQQSVPQTTNAQAIPSPLLHQTLLTPGCFGRLLETGSSDQNQNQYYQQQHLQQTKEKRLLPNCEVIFNKQGVPVLVGHVNKTTSYFQPRLPAPTQQMSRNLPAQQQPQQATSFNSQVQQQPQQPPRNWQQQSSSCQQMHDNAQFFNPTQFQLYQQQLQQQMANFGPAYNSRFCPPMQQPLQMQSLLHQRLTQQHQPLRFSVVPLIDPPQYSLHQNLPGFNSAGSPNGLPATVQQLMSPPATVDQIVSLKDKKANPKKRSKQTNSRHAKVQAVEMPNFSKGSAAFPEQLNIATDVYKNLVLGSLSENAHSDRPATYLSPKQKNPIQRSSSVEEIEQPNDQELGSSSKNVSTISDCPPSVSPTGSLPMLIIDENISGSTNHDESNQINIDTNSLLVCASPLVTPTNNNNADLQNHSCFSIANDKTFSDVISTTTVTIDETDFEEECCVCQNGNGPLLHCSGPDCFRSYHLNHHIPQYEKVPDDRFVCCLCINIGDHKTIEDKTRSIYGITTGLAYMTEYERKVCERILLNLFCHTESLPFHTIEKEFYDNFKKGVTPMDLKTIKNKLHSKIYSSVEEFIHDVNQIFVNCNIYHDSASENGQKGQIVGRHYWNLVQEYIPRWIGLVKLNSDTATKN